MCLLGVFAKDRDNVSHLPFSAYYIITAGLNVVSLINDQIIESVAKMNEFYLSGAGDAQKQYTMCHEVRLHQARYSVAQ